MTEEGYRDARSFSEGLAAVNVGDKWGYISR
ncbi:WG repeat-containing protein [Microcoleus sp. FACHB-SPT15]